jgi:hypothetical protein
MQNFLMRLKHKMLGMSPPNFSSFATNVSGEFRDSYQGACADTFFSNDGPTIHKWLHYLPIYDKLFSEYVATNVRFLEIGVFKGRIAADVAQTAGNAGADIWRRHQPGTGIEFLKDKIDEMHLPYVKRGMNQKQFMADIESIQFFDSIAAIRKRAQLPRFHVQSPPAADG